MSVVLCAFAIVLLLIASAMISGSEIAFFSLPQNFLEGSEIFSEKDRKIKILRSNPRKLLGTILLINNFVNILTVLLFAVVSGELFGGFSTKVRFVFEVVIITFFILLFGEVLPKIYADRKPLYFARLLVTPIYYLEKRLRGVVGVLDFFTRLIEQKIPFLKHASKNQYLTAQDLMQPISLAVGVCWEDDFLTIKEVFKKYSFSLYPVFRGDAKIVGYIKAADLLADRFKNDFDWRTKITPIFTVLQTDSLQKLYTNFKTAKNKFAIVLDTHKNQVGFTSKSIVIKTLLARKNY